MSAFPPGLRVRWGHEPCQVVDASDPKLKKIRHRVSNKLVLVVAHNGQLVWVRAADLTEEESL